MLKLGPPWCWNCDGNLRFRVLTGFQVGHSISRAPASITATAQRSARALSCRGSAFPLSTGSSATLGDGLAEACQRLPSSYDDGAADGTAGLAGRQIRATVQGEAASSTSVPARSANNGIGCHNVKIAVVA